MASPPPVNSCTGMSSGPGARPGFVVFIAALTSGTVTAGPPACVAASEAMRRPWVAIAAKTCSRACAEVSRRAETAA
eukprot:212474-Chlamydomonas_euryale.AAC.1